MLKLGLCVYQIENPFHFNNNKRAEFKTQLSLMTEELSKTYNPSDFEDELYKWWMTQGYFKPEKMVELGIVNENSDTFCNTIPPPNVTGVLHLGHAITIALQDLMVRYARMNGKKTVFVPGTDHAGIATQNVVERELNKKGLDRKELGREKFLEEVWKWKEQSHQTITQQSMRLGLSSDWDRERFTMDDQLSRAVREAFVRLYNKDLIYQGNYLVNWCPGRCESAISDLEAEPVEEEGKLWYIRYPVATKDWEGPSDTWGSGNFAKGATKFIEVATTRPETLLGDSAVAIPKDSKRYQKLDGQFAILPAVGRKIPIIVDEHVDAEFGTGAVKVTPAHDFNDYEIGLRHDLEFITMMTDKGRIEEGYEPYSGMDRFEARVKMVEDLENEGLLIKTESHTHMLPHCQRCKTVVEPRDSLQWFVRVKPLAQQVLDKIDEQGINIIPENQMDRLQKWIDPEFIRDWCISRQLWWGHRIPIWYCDDCGETSSGIEDLEECQHCGSTTIRQDEDVLDTWFSSGLWPFSTLGWPEETQDMKDFYPNDLRETGYDILFFWVAREMMLGVELTGKLPYKNIYFHGLVRNEHGAKISKSMENIEEYDPLNIIDEQGADTLRYTLIAYSSPGLDMNLDPKYLEGTHKFGNKLWQMVRYVLGNIPDDFEYTDPAAGNISKLEFADQWMLSALNSLIINVTQFYEQYNFLEAARELRRFAWNVFADWYIEITKIRIYDESYSGFDPRNILLHVIEVLLRLLHPIMPFMTEKLWSHLPQELREREALIISPWPQAQTELVNQQIESDFILLQEIITAIRGIRGEFTVPPSKQIAAIISAGDQYEVFDKTRAELADLAGIDPNALEIHQEINPEGKLISTVTEGISVFIPLEGLVEIDDEIKRIEKEIADIENRIKRSEGKLNSEFANRAPPHIVEEERERLTAMQADKSKLEERKQVLLQ